MGDVVLDDGSVRPAAEAETLALTPRDPEAVAEEAFAQRRRTMFDNATDKAKTFAEGVVDALSMGLVRETGETADIRRDVNSGWALAGNVLGFAGGMAGGPVRAITHGAEAAGRAAAKTVLRSEAGSIVSRAAQEAAAGAALGGGQAFGHAVMDTIIEDKEFASEAILHEVKLGGVIGGIGGALLGGLAKVARKDIAGQGGIVGDVDEAIKPHYEATQAYDAVVQRHAAEVGALRELHAAGEVPEQFLKDRVSALRNAARVRDALDKIDVRKAMSGSDDVLYRKFQRVSTQYRAAVGELDNVMQGARPNPRAGIDALNELVEKLPVRTDKSPTESFDTGSPAAAVDDAAMTFEPTAAPPAGAPRRAPANSGEVMDYAMGGGGPGGPSGTGRPGMGYMDTGVQPLQVRPDIEAGWQTPPGYPSEVDAGWNTPAGYPSALDAGWHTPPGYPKAAADVAPVEPFVPDVADALPSKPRPFDAAEARVQQAMADLVAKTGGRLDSAGALGILERSGIAPSVDNVGAYMDQVYAMRKAGLFAADEARGVATPLRSALEGAMAGGIGHAVAGPLGAVAAVAGEMMYLRRGGRIAAAGGRLAGTVAKAAQSLLTTNRVRVAAGALAGASANNAWAYSDKGPIKDPVERIQEIQFLAANPDHIRERVAETAKDLADQPHLLAALQDRAVGQITNLSLKAPAILYDKLGRALMPPGGKLRAFFEYENAIHDLPALLKAVASGTVTRPQVAGLQEAWPSVHIKMASALLADPEALKKMPREVLRAVEAITGAPLSNASDPQWLMRQTAAWVPPPAPDPQAPQAFNINPAGAPTPAQANATGRAPGN